MHFNRPENSSEICNERIVKNRVDYEDSLPLLTLQKMAAVIFQSTY